MSHMKKILKEGKITEIIPLLNQTYNKNVILSFVCEFGHLEVVKYLVEECGVDVRVNDDHAIKCASADGRLNIVKYLVEKCGVNARAQNDFAVSEASKYGHLEVVKYLIEKCGANSRDAWAVMNASRYGHLEVVKYLVEKCGADARVNSNYAVRWASWNNHF